MVHNEVHCMIVVRGDELKVWEDPNPVEKLAFESRLTKLLAGAYSVDDQGRCIIDQDDINPDRPWGRNFKGERGGETCVSTERNFGDVRVKVEVCKAHR